VGIDASIVHPIRRHAVKGIVLSKQGGWIMRSASSGRFGQTLWWMLCAFCVARALHAQAAPIASTYPRPMTAEEAQDFAHVLGMLKPGRPYVLNLADPQQLRFTQNALALAGRTSSSAPETFAVLQATTQRARALAATAATGAEAWAAKPLLANAPGAPQDIETISNFGDDGNGIFTATGYSSVVGGTTQTTITTQLIDTQTKTVYASASDTQYGQGTNFQVPVTGKVPSTANLAAVATIVTSVGNNSNTTVVSTATMVPASTGTMTAPNYCVHVDPSNPNSNCVINGGQTQYQTGSTTLVPNPPLIKICFNRGNQQSCFFHLPARRISAATVSTAPLPPWAAIPPRWAIPSRVAHVYSSIISRWAQDGVFSMRPPCNGPCRSCR
jgi:hypothetical protein